MQEQIENFENVEVPMTIQQAVVLKDLARAALEQSGYLQEMPF